MTASQATGAASFFHVESPYVIRNLRDRIRLAKEETEGHLAGGHVISWEDYKYQTGIIEGLKRCLDMLAELEKQERT